MKTYSYSFNLGTNDKDADKIKQTARSEYYYKPLNAFI